MAKATTKGAFAALALDVEKTITLTLTHPVTGEDLVAKDGRVAFVEHYGGDSSVADKALKRVRMERQSQRNPAKIDHLAERAMFLALISKDWLLVDFEGNVIDVPFSVENATELFGDNATFWIAEQVDDSAGNRKGFMKASSQI